MPTTIATLDVLIRGDSASLKRSLEESERDIEQFGSRAGSSLTALGRTLTATLTTTLVAGFGLAVNAAMSFEDQFANVAKTVDGTDAQLAQLSRQLRDLATDTANPISTLSNAQEQLLNIATVAGQLGVRVDDIKAFTESIALLASASTLNAEQAATMMAQFLNVVGKSPQELAPLVDVIVELGNNFATTEDRILRVAQRFGNVGATANIAAEDILALSTALLALGVTPEIASSSLTAMVANMLTATTEGGEALQAFTRTTGMSMQEFDASLQENGIETVRAFLEGLSQLSSSEQVDVLDKVGLGGVRRTPAILALVNNLDLLDRALADARGQMVNGGAAMEEAEKKARTAAAQFRFLFNNIRELGISIGELFTPALGSMARSLGEAIGRLADADANFLRLATGVGAALAALGPTIYALGIVAGLINPITLAVAALATAFITNFDSIKSAVENVFGPGTSARTALEAVKTEIDNFFNSLRTVEPDEPIMVLLPAKLDAQSVGNFEDVIIRAGDSFSAIVARTPAIGEALGGLYTDEFWIAAKYIEDNVTNFWPGERLTGATIGAAVAAAGGMGEELGLQFSGPYYDAFNEVMTIEQEKATGTLGERFSEALGRLGDVIVENLPDFSYAAGQLTGRFIKGLGGFAISVYDAIVEAASKVDTEGLIATVNDLIVQPFLDGLFSNRALGTVDFSGFVSDIETSIREEENPLLNLFLDWFKAAWELDLASITGYVESDVVPALEGLGNYFYVPVPSLQLPDISFAAGQFVARIIKAYAGLSGGIYTAIINQLRKVDVGSLIASFRTNVLDPFIAGLTSNRGLGNIDFRTLANNITNNIGKSFKTAALLLISITNPFAGILLGLLNAAFEADLGGIRTFWDTKVKPFLQGLLGDLGIDTGGVDLSGIASTIDTLIGIIKPIAGAAVTEAIRIYDEVIQPGLDNLERGVSGFIAAFDGMDWSGIEAIAKVLVVAVAAVAGVMETVVSAAWLAATDALAEVLPVVGTGIRLFAEGLALLVEGNLVEGLITAGKGILTIASALIVLPLDMFTGFVDYMGRLAGISPSIIGDISDKMKAFFDIVAGAASGAVGPIMAIVNAINDLIDTISNAPSWLGGMIGIDTGGGGSGVYQTGYGTTVNSAGQAGIGFGNPSANDALYGSAPGSHMGGMLRPRMPTWVGEKGPEIFVPNVPGEIIPNYATKGMGDGGGDTNTGNVYIYNPSFIGSSPHEVMRNIERAKRQSGRRM